MGHKIEKAVPMPEKPRTGRKPLYPFRAMEIGDSFLVAKAEKSKAVHTLSMFNYRNKTLKFSGRTMPDGSFRIWRIK